MNLVPWVHRRRVKILLWRARGGHLSHFGSQVIFNKPNVWDPNFRVGAWPPSPLPPPPTRRLWLGLGESLEELGKFAWLHNLLQQCTSNQLVVFGTIKCHDHLFTTIVRAPILLTQLTCVSVRQ